MIAWLPFSEKSIEPYGVRKARAMMLLWDVQFEQVPLRELVGLTSQTLQHTYFDLTEAVSLVGQEKGSYETVVCRVPRAPSDMADESVRLFTQMVNLAVQQRKTLWLIPRESEFYDCNHRYLRFRGHLGGV